MKSTSPHVHGGCLDEPRLTICGRLLGRSLAHSLAHYPLASCFPDMRGCLVAPRGPQHCGRPVAVAELGAYLASCKEGDSSPLYLLAAVPAHGALSDSSPTSARTSVPQQGKAAQRAAVDPRRAGAGGSGGWGNRPPLRHLPHTRYQLLDPGWFLLFGIWHRMVSLS